MRIKGRYPILAHPGTSWHILADDCAVLSLPSRDNHTGRGPLWQEHEEQEGDIHVPHHAHACAPGSRAHR
jgi:hypothetical protein